MQSMRSECCRRLPTTDILAAAFPLWEIETNPPDRSLMIIDVGQAALLQEARRLCSLSSADLVYAASNCSGFMLILHSLARQPLSCRKVCRPSNIRMWVKPISLMNSSFACSDSVGIVFVTRNIVLMISCEEYPRSLSSKSVRFSHMFHGRAYHSSLSVSTALSILHS